ncbi:hypothetical protein Dimus_025178 [Dionaea muscipula]
MHRSRVYQLLVSNKKERDHVDKSLDVPSAVPTPARGAGSSTQVNPVPSIPEGVQGEKEAALNPTMYHFAEEVLAESSASTPKIRGGNVQVPKVGLQSIQEEEEEFDTEPLSQTIRRQKK